MAFFDEFNKRINNIAQSAQKTAETAKINREISQKQAEFDSLFHQIGQLYYSCRQRGVQPDESIDALCDRVSLAAQEIDKLRSRIDEIRDICRCPVCGTTASREAQFCSKCGAKLENAPAREPEKAEEADPVEAPAREPEKDVFIDWPEARPDAEPEPSAEESAGQSEAPAEDSADDCETKNAAPEGDENA